jgi:hypothetical protein
MKPPPVGVTTVVIGCVVAGFGVTAWRCGLTTDPVRVVEGFELDCGTVEPYR